MTKRVRVRFAPSPTGPLHIGGVRTALFNYLFARKHGGDFLLRIEDTDMTRYVPGAEQYIIESLAWLGITFDEGVHCGGPCGPYRQSDRKHLYRQYADQLIASGNAYYAFDTPEELSALREKAETAGGSFTYGCETRGSLRNSLTMTESEVQGLLSAGSPYVIRFKMPISVDVHLFDEIRKEVTYNTKELDDKVLFKSDGMPTYHLANVVDDYLMKITHVIRGEEWLSSMPLHVLLYRALGWEASMPSFSHLPLILKPVGQGKLSKRDGQKMGFPVFPLEWTDESGETFKGYREDGYLPHAVINMLALLGWNPGDDREIMSIEELTEAFTLERIGKSGSKFDSEKAKWFNHQYITKLENAQLAELVKPIFAKQGITVADGQLQHIVGLIKERLTFPSDAWDQAFYFFKAPSEFDEKVVKKHWKGAAPANLKAVRDLLAAATSFVAAENEAMVKQYLEQNQIGMGGVMNCLRLSLVGTSMGVHLFDICEVLGKEETLRRIDFALTSLPAAQ